MGKETKISARIIVDEYKDEVFIVQLGEDAEIENAIAITREEWDRIILEYGSTTNKTTSLSALGIKGRCEYVE